ncbi:hypothetical protein BU24DRAFT_457346 [Aaosphaeria arxii CBS 175.79]|uniref:RING-type domain-containing protein n=1 Tax=Aaosphaeria arxii CBS 175.79 TaxID=1450172 RepID=A0A6A5Y9U2_9PLEO|nr:uncharacterized protein BU24DRAFT_457346 [Aaosphaeria arxii CBS 175.79]KAF2021364.1 hypothetical protein BU24DRAFT_457346 [Aaosphaeria arxii CBS 175.79]
MASASFIGNGEVSELMAGPEYPVNPYNPVSKQIFDLGKRLRENGKFPGRLSAYFDYKYDPLPSDGLDADELEMIRLVKVAQEHLDRLRHFECDRSSHPDLRSSIMQRSISLMKNCQAISQGIAAFERQLDYSILGNHGAYVNATRDLRHSIADDIDSANRTAREIVKEQQALWVDSNIDMCQLLPLTGSSFTYDEVIRFFKGETVQGIDPNALTGGVHADYFSEPVAFSADLADESCPVCLDPYDEKEPIRKLGCSHVAHSSCITQWLLADFERSDSCMICRAKFHMEPQNKELVPLKTLEGAANYAHFNFLLTLIQESQVTLFTIMSEMCTPPR